MKVLIAPIIVLFFILLQSCATVSELHDPTDLALGYSEIKTEEGETHFKRTRKRDINFETDQIMIRHAAQEVVYTPKEEVLESNLLDKKVSKSPNFRLELANTTEYMHLGASVLFRDAKEPWEFRLGASLFDTESIVYAGFDGGVRYYIPVFELDTFAGTGFYIGDNKQCENTYVGDVAFEECTKRFLTAGFVELGIQYKNFGLFARRYGIRDSGIEVPAKNFIGINLDF